MIVDAIDLMDAINWFTRFERVLLSPDTFIHNNIRYKVVLAERLMPDKMDKFRVVQCM